MTGKHAVHRCQHFHSSTKLIGMKAKMNYTAHGHRRKPSLSLTQSVMPLIDTKWRSKSSLIAWILKARRVGSSQGYEKVEGPQSDVQGHYLKIFWNSDKRSLNYSQALTTNESKSLWQYHPIHPANSKDLLSIRHWRPFPRYHEAASAWSCVWTCRLSLQTTHTMFVKLFIVKPWICGPCRVVPTTEQYLSMTLNRSRGSSVKVIDTDVSKMKNP